MGERGGVGVWEHGSVSDQPLSPLSAGIRRLAPKGRPVYSHPRP